VRASALCAYSSSSWRVCCSDRHLLDRERREAAAAHHGGVRPAGPRRQHLWEYCSGGFYARHGDTIVLTSSGHCTSEGTVAYDPDGTTVRGVFGPAARDASCPHPGHTCAASDLNYMVVAVDRIPWGT